MRKALLHLHAGVELGAWRYSQAPSGVGSCV